MDTINNNTRELNEIIRLATLLFPVYSSPLGESIIISDVSKLTDGNLGRKLYGYVKDSLRSLIRDCLFRPENIVKTTATSNKRSVNSDSDSDSDSEDESLSLPKLQKYLLISSHLCSSIKSSTDAFVYTSASAPRPKKQKKSNEQNTSHLSTSNNSIPLERILSVFTSIYPGEKNLGNVGVFEGVAHLCRLGYLEEKVGGERVRYWVKVGREVVEGIGRSEGFDVGEYLD